MISETTLIFVDGENLVHRYQEMLKAGYKPAEGTVHIPDCFVWNPNILKEQLWNMKRISYYTSVVGDDLKVRDIREKIGAIKYECQVEGIPSGDESSTVRTGQLIPFVHKKSSKSNKESVCDIAIAVDVMRACYRDHADTIWLFSGDGDFLPLIKEVVHSGKSAYMSAFTSGLQGEFRFAVDEFLPLEKHFFKGEPEAM
jgi:uncharacterized LabA/DUF88 family protein